jgi:hypothetical protein
MTEVRKEIAFIVTKVFWTQSPTAGNHRSPPFIDGENNYEVLQDSCLMGAGGFLALLQFWWSFQWPDEIAKCTRLPRNSIHCISINLLEYCALIVGLAGSIVAWESLPTKSRPAHPMILLLTDDTTAKSWTKRISAWTQDPTGSHLGTAICSYSHVFGRGRSSGTHCGRGQCRHRLPLACQKH